MKLIRTEDAIGHVLCHDMTQIIKDQYKDARFRKGHIVTEKDIPVLLSMGKEHLYVWEMTPGMLHEDELWTPKLYLLANTVKYADICLYNYVQREGSITNRTDKVENVRHAKKIFFQLEEYYRSLGLTRCQRNILTSYLARKMISVCQMSEKERTTLRDRKFILRNSRDIRSIGKMILFFVFPNRYQVLRGILKKIIRY